MKNLLQQAILLSLACTIVNCSSPTTNTDNTSTTDTTATASSKSKTYVLSTKDTISVDTFNAWKNNWYAYGKDWLDTANLIAFTMPLVDLSEVVKEDDIAESRFYLGLKQGSMGFKAKMMLVGVDSMNQDMIDYANGEYVYDLSKSCPPYCNQ